MISKINDITDFMDFTDHLTQECMCARCFKRWIAVMPVRTQLKDLVCPGCGRTGAVFATGQILESDLDGD